MVPSLCVCKVTPVGYSCTELYVRDFDLCVFIVLFRLHSIVALVVLFRLHP
jgi:hypothetical protein